MTRTYKHYHSRRMTATWRSITALPRLKHVMLRTYRSLRTFPVAAHLDALPDAGEALHVRLVAALRLVLVVRQAAVGGLLLCLIDLHHATRLTVREDTTFARSNDV